ncbi:MAG: tetratricopeptide repeat protein [Gammaproteobacteria bacterium]|nr:tetratricopeptide repeat protein [Gammaproteobacteria bacterium]
MNIQTRSGLAGLILVSVCAAHGAEPRQRLDLAAADELFQRAILDHGGIDKAVGHLQVTALDTAKIDRDRSNAWLAIAHLHWRYGQLAPAADATKNALEIHQDVDGMLLYARLLDARGDPEGASPWYERAAERTSSAAERDFIRLRLTLSEASNRNVDTLIELAKERDRAFRNRAAITLALLGHADSATRLYEVSAELGSPFRQRARIAHWAIESGDFERAQIESWQAVRAAATRADRLYALALLVEAHRNDDALAELLVRLAPETSGDEFDADILETRIDVLIETENYDEAIDFYHTMDDKRVDPASRRRLINLYQAAGRTDEMIAEYEQLMAAEPDVVPWFAGLASHYLNVAQPDAALAVWHQLVSRNPGRVEVLTEAAGAMVQMGFADEALAMIEDHMAAAGESLDALLFLFELRHGRGEEEAALGALERLQAVLAGGTHGIRDLADAYERLNKPDESIRILESLRTSEGELGYNERMRLAWLYSFAGRKEDAMGAWQDLWVSVDSPARRNLAETQFLLLATELNQLGDIVVDLEEKLILKRADRNEIGLLVRIYTEVGDSLSATEVIEEFARYSGDGEIDRLRRLGRVHMMLSDYAAYDKVLRELVIADPDNRLEHTQNIVLNMLAYDIAEESQGAFGEIQRWLGQLRQLDNEGVSGEFEAGIYSLGGFAEEAIASYRRALVTDPENSDNLLLLADMLKNAGRRDEAVEMLQYAAEHAADNSAFVVAVDGIINMIGARSFNETLTARMRDTFGWTRRIILERIAGHDDKFYLYQLLADIAQEVGDMQAAFVALENSLSVAGVRRPAVLRELVTLATPNAGFAGFTTGTGDAERQITHGRRLVGLKQELPPEVYINLGRVLLEKGAVQDAERAFDRIDDITGMIDVERTKADLFYEAGITDRARDAYTRALNVRRDDLSLLTRTALLREALGQDAVAHTLYFRGLSNLLRAQPSTRPTQRPGASQRPALVALGLDADTSVTRDYRQYFEALMQGLLITWPDDEAVGHETVEAVKALFDTEFEAIAKGLATQGAQPAPDDERDDLDQYPRLERMSWFANRVADQASDPSISTHVDGKLQRYFPIEATEPAADTPLLRRQLEAAMRDDDFETAVRLARVADDEDGLVSLLRERIDAGEYRDGLGYARSLLDPMALRRLLTAVAPTLKDNKRAFAEAISTAPAAVLGIEEDLGRELISPAELVDLLNDPEVADDTDNPFAANVGVWKFIKAKWDVDQQIDYFAAYAARQEKNKTSPPSRRQCCTTSSAKS